MQCKQKVPPTDTSKQAESDNVPNKHRGAADLEVNHDFARHFAEEPGLRDVPHNGRRQAQEYHKEVGNREVHDENICYGPHRVIRVNRQAYERVANLWIEQEEWKFYIPLRCANCNLMG